jgi:hypothetical protein
MVQFVAGAPGSQEIVRRDPGLSQDRAPGSFRHIVRMTWNGYVTSSGWIEPDFMRAGDLTLEHEPELLQTADNVPVSEAAPSAPWRCYIAMSR